MHPMALVGALSQTALSEITSKGKAYFAMQANPFLSEEKRDKALNELLDNLTDETLTELLPVLIMQLQFSQKRANKFKGADEQADAYIARRPKMGEYRELILERMKEYRQQCGLEV